MAKWSGRLSSLLAKIKPVVNWHVGFAVSLAVFVWSLLTVSSQVTPSVFSIFIRGVGPVNYSTALVLVSPLVDQILLALSATIVLLALELGLVEATFVGRVVLMVPAVLLALSFIYPLVLIPLGALGVFAAILFTIIRSNAVLNASPGRTLFWALFLTIIPFFLIALISAGRWVANGFDGSTPFSGWTWYWNVLLLRILNQAYWLLPRLLVILLLSWAFRLLLGLYKGEVESVGKRLTTAFGADGAEQSPAKVSWHWEAYLVLASALAAVFVAVYGYLPMVNPSSLLVGSAAAGKYYGFAQTMLSRDPLQAIGYSFSHGGAVILLLLYWMAGAFGTVDFAVRAVAPLFAVIYTLATYLFVRVCFHGRFLAATASMFAAMSFVTTTGVAGGYFGSWLAGSEILVLFSFLSIGFEKNEWKWVILSVWPSALLLFTHEWTWIVAMASVALYLLTTVVRNLVRERRLGTKFELAAPGFILAYNIAFEGILYLLGDGGDIGGLYRYAASTLSLGNLLGTVGSLQSTIALFLGGALDDPVFVALAALGVLTFRGITGGRRLLFFWFAVGASVALFSNFGAALVPARILLLLPLQIFAALGFVYITYAVAQTISRGTMTSNSVIMPFGLLTYTKLAKVKPARVTVWGAYVLMFCLLLSHALLVAGML